MDQENFFDFDRNESLPVSDYDLRIRQVVPGYEAIFNMVMAMLNQSLSQHGKILIVGAGNGTEICVFAHQSEWQMIAVDPSEKMLEIASSKVASLDLSQRVQLIKGTVSDIPETTICDVATSILVMHLLPMMAVSYHI